MKYPIIKRQIKSALVGILAVSAMTAQQSSFAADDNQGTFFGKNAPGKWIIGGKIAQIDINVPGVSDGDAAGIVLGYEFASSIGDAGGSATVEFEYLTGDDTIDSLNTNYDVDVANLFFTYRSAGKLYYKVKGGLSYVDFEVNSFDQSSDFNDVSAAFGVGLGYRVSDLGVVEIEYSADTGDSDLGILGLNALLEF